MSGDLRNPSKAIPKGTLWAMLTTFIVYVTVVLSMAASTTRESLLNHTNILSLTNLSSTVILAGECAVSYFSAVMTFVGSARLLQAISRDKLLPGVFVFGLSTKKGDNPISAIILTYILCQISLFADLDQRTQGLKPHFMVRVVQQSRQRLKERFIWKPCDRLNGRLAHDRVRIP